MITPREIKADKACPYIRSTAEGTHHCALATAPDDKLREAARMALEVLEALQGGCTDSDDGTIEAITVYCPEVIAALREALEGKE